MREKVDGCLDVCEAGCAGAEIAALGCSSVHGL